MDQSFRETPGLLNRMTTGGRVGMPPSSPGTGLVNIEAATNRPRRTPLPTKGCQTSGHLSSTTIMNNSHSIIMASTRGVRLGIHRVSASDRRHLLFNSRMSLLCPRNIRNIRRRQEYRWISTRCLLVERSMDCRSRATISWAAMSMHSWVVCSDLRTNNFLRNMKKMAKFCGKHMARLAHISDRDNVGDPRPVFVSTLPP